MAGLDDDICERLHALFMARWAYFHTPLFTAAHFLESEYIAIKPTGKEKMCASKPLLLGHECYLAWLPCCGLLAFRWPSERTFWGRKANETFRPSAFRNIQARSPPRARSSPGPASSAGHASRVHLGVCVCACRHAARAHMGSVIP